MRRTIRGGFSLIDLLVLLAILGLLLAFLLPALMRIRSSADRVSSINNLKMLGLACHNYHDAYRMFPPGVDDRNYSAVARLLPFIEQQALFTQLNFDKPCDDPVNAAVRRIPVKLLLSPRDPIPAVHEDEGATNYLFCAGSKYSLDTNDGVFYRNSATTLQQIMGADGTSQTMMIAETLKGDGGRGEKSVARRHVQLDAAALKRLTANSGVSEFRAGKHLADDRGARWIDGRFLQASFTATRRANDGRPDVCCGGKGGLSGLRTLDGTVPVCFCDGSVRPLSAKIEEKIWKALASTNGGEKIQSRDLEP